MVNQYVSFIDDSVFESHVKFLLDKARSGQTKALKNPERNVIDPFAALFSMTAFELKPTEWSKNEFLRQAGKSLENALGDFHQKLIGSIDGWECLKIGKQIDIISHRQKIIAEIKNKHNTVKASDKINIYKELDGLVNLKNMQFKDFTAYFVVIIPSKPERFNCEFTPPDRDRGDKAPLKSNVREIDGNSFYELATGRKDALKEIFEAIPRVIEKITHKNVKTEYEFALQFFNKALTIEHLN